ncbi:hypothetical protein J2S22_001305 [Rhodoplanes tepidamans]|nr:hypothetical protein [Rhodoplanes tepidamans]
MADDPNGRVSRQRFQVSYFGDNPNDHAMDVDALGPALVAFGKLVRSANGEVNGERAAVRLLVTSDFENKCFNINFEIIQTILNQITDLFQSGSIEKATDLLKKLGVVTSGVAAATGTVFGYLKWKNGRQVETAQETKDPPGSIIVKVEGDGNTINVSPTVYRLAQSDAVLDAIEGVLAPIVTQKSVASIAFSGPDKRSERYGREDVAAIVASCSDRKQTPVTTDDPEPRTVTAVLYAYGPVFDVKAPNWRFKYKKKPIYVDIRQTSIARDAVKRGGSSVDDRYKVRLQITDPETDEEARRPDHGRSPNLPSLLSIPRQRLAFPSRSRVGLDDADLQIIQHRRQPRRCNQLHRPDRLQLRDGAIEDCQAGVPVEP